MNYIKIYIYFGDLEVGKFSWVPIYSTQVYDSMYFSSPEINQFIEMTSD